MLLVRSPNSNLKMEETSSNQKEDQNMNDANVLSNHLITIIKIDKFHVKVLCNECCFAFNAGLLDIFEAVRQHFRLPCHKSFQKKELPAEFELALQNYESTLPLPFSPIKALPETLNGKLKYLCDIV